MIRMLILTKLKMMLKKRLNDNLLQKVIDMKVRRLFLYVISFLLLSAFKHDDSMWKTRFLFGINCEYADIHHDSRTHVEFAIAHDSLIVFPTYKDTIVFFNMGGKIVHKIHHTMGSYPIKIEYDNTKDLLYCFVRKSDTRQDQIIVLNRDGIIQKTYIVTKNYLRTWLRIAGYSQKRTSEICNAVKGCKSYHPRLIFPKELVPLLLYKGILNGDKVLLQFCYLGYPNGSTNSCDIYLIKQKKHSEFLSISNFTYYNSLPFEKKICDTNLKNSNFSKVRSAAESRPLKSKNTIISIQEVFAGFYFFITEPPTLK